MKSELIKSLKNEFKTYLNTEKLINSTREDIHEAMICDDLETLETKRKYINGLIEKQNNQIEIACESFKITVIDFLGLLEEYELTKQK